MSWLTWRAHRITLTAWTTFLVGLGVMFGGLAAMLRVLYPDGDIDVCAIVPAHDAPPMCGGSTFLQLFGSFAADVREASDLLGPVVPLAIGSFLAAPIIAQEFRSGTARWAVTQGISRDRWLFRLVSTVLTFVAAGLVVFELGYQAWRAVMGPHVSTGSDVPMAFEMGPVAMGAKVLFAVALGLLIGAAVRSPGPAIALTGAGWIAVMILIEQPWTEYQAPMRAVEIGVLLALAALSFLALWTSVRRRAF